MTIRAKMEVNEVVDTTYSDTVKLQCVMGRKNKDGSYRQTTDAENKEDNSFASATPSGKMELQISNPALKGVIKAGQRFYVDLIPCDS